MLEKLPVRRLGSLRIGVKHLVAMQRNIGDLPQLLQLGKSLGVMHFHVNNLLPRTEHMSHEVLYAEALRSITYSYSPSPWLRRLILPKMDLNEQTIGPFRAALDSGYNVIFAGTNLGLSNDVCTFIESGSMIVGWDGSVSPCSPLLYTHVGYLRGYERKSYRHIIGHVGQRGLLDLWLAPEYVE
ncbi:MAG: SPASM domain-containing protein [Candidatus Promineofilum sp.]|nr:SPASM domain-containing protein [Promineifilum sp.]MCW5861894.1 SPASM domain-containing protein [Anaerolineae bacterium]